MESNVDIENDPVVIFYLGPSEQIHECLQLPNSPVQAGATLQDSFIEVLKWIEQTVTSIPISNSLQNSVSGVPPPPGPSPLNIQHQTFNHHPLFIIACCRTSWLG